MKANVNNNQCDRCGACISVCPTNAILLLAATLEIDRGLCTGCGTCVKVCPFGALALESGLQTIKAEGASA
jgi:ferredoxin